jgi:hypothetical protein
MEHASGVPNQSYHVTIPPFSTGNPSRDNIAYLPDLDALGKLNVAYLVADYDLDLDGLIFNRKIGDSRIYQNPALRPRAWVQSIDSPIGMNYTPAIIKYWSPNRIEINAQGPGLLVLSEIVYPGWKARIDGEIQPVLSPGNIFRGLMLEPGNHKVDFYFVPQSLALGIILLVVGLVVWSVLFFQGRQA